MITEVMKQRIDRCVLCWLATADPDGVPNVSPKEMFLTRGDNTLLIAHIASPVTVKNIRRNTNVCVSMADIFVQKGYKFTGTARIIVKDDPDYPPAKELLTQKFGTRFPIQAVIEVTVHSLQEIIAPSYRFFPETASEQRQIDQAIERYRVRPR